jgi:uncharacterized protein (TIGR03086 family)
MDEIELLSGIVTKTGNVIAGVGPDQLDDPTPCPEMNVSGMVGHLVGLIRSFAAAANGSTYEGDPTDVDTADPAADFRVSADSLVAGWREHGFDRRVSIAGGEGQPAEMVFNITVMEYLTHGWDLAVATGQPVPYTEEEAAEVLRRAEGTLSPEYRGEAMAFGEVVPVPDDAPAIDRLVGFLGRRPRPA